MKTTRCIARLPGRAARRPVGAERFRTTASAIMLRLHGARVGDRTVTARVVLDARCDFAPPPRVLGDRQSSRWRRGEGCVATLRISWIGGSKRRGPPVPNRSRSRRDVLELSPPGRTRAIVPSRAMSNGRDPLHLIAYGIDFARAPTPPANTAGPIGGMLVSALRWSAFFPVRAARRAAVRRLDHLGRRNYLDVAELPTGVICARDEPLRCACRTATHGSRVGDGAGGRGRVARYCVATSLASTTSATSSAESATIRRSSSRRRRLSAPS